MFVEECIASVFEGLDLGGTEFHVGLLLLMEFFAFLMNRLVLQLRGIVGKEALDIGLKLDELLVLRDLCAEFLGFRYDGCFL